MSEPKASSGFTKFIMSKTAGTSSGRKLIKGKIGESGNELIAIVTNISKHLCGSKIAKKNQERILRFALKVKLMFDDGHITAKTALHLIDPIDHLLGKFVQTLSKKDTKNEDELALANSIDRLRFEVVELCGKFMQVAIL